MAKKRKVDVDYIDDFDDELESHEESPKQQNKYKIVKAFLLDQEEVNALVEASSSLYVEPPQKPFSLEYLTYSQEEVLALIKGDYKPRKFKKKK